MGTVLVTSRSFSSGRADVTAQLQASGHRVVRGPSDHDLETLRPLLADAVAWIAGTGPVTAAHLDAGPGLRVVARYGVGVEAVDLAAARDRGIVVTNTPGANSDAVADHTVGLMLAAIRGTAAGDRRVRAGDWSTTRGREIADLSIGIVGFGRIGQGVARRLSGFGPRLLVADPFVPDEVITSFGASARPVDDLAPTCDLVSLHAPGGRTVVSSGWLGRARQGMTIVNTARADLVDEAALAGAIRDGVVVAYAADTIAGDTGARDSPLLSPDLADRVTITPHLGAQTVEAIDNMGGFAVEDVLSVLAGRAPEHPVALPTAAPSRKARP
ncbi:NAD(P)-dependent oxidoreductase [Labedella endophytica]|uniref:Hydroxyacid dehydrogenase n=1 Tax=Labedella endophytica TaxID=1523160 RepID=A0A3S1CSU9_9MICO|nr:NAD(P)-dependent oxidoreductase [Labedella endophytica]RUR01681.1 hydroxyacid dehydrogenase [Labedella endophytica]